MSVCGSLDRVVKEILPEKVHQPKDDLGESFPGRVNLKDKGPELGASIAYLRSNRTTVGSSE